jgi:aquaporin related protein
MSDNGVNGKNHEERLPYHEPTTTPPRKERGEFHHTLRTELTAFIGEFIGTFMFLSLAFAGTQIAVNDPGAPRSNLEGPSTTPDVTKLLYIALSFGVSLAINVAIFADISGAKFNPVVSVFQANGVFVPPCSASPLSSQPRMV